MGSNKITDKNRLSNSGLKVVREWNYKKNKLTTNDVAVYSTKRAWWKCPNNHEWEAIIQSRTRKTNPHNCPYCSGYRPSKENNLLTVSPQLMREWNYEKNDKVDALFLTNGTPRKVWWKCSRGHEWRAAISSRTLGKASCPYCANKKTNNDNCLANKNIHLSKEWNYHKNKTLTPRDVVPMSGKKVWWICKNNHEWRASVAHRSLGNGCPYCSNKRVYNKNCLKTINPPLAKEWHLTKNGNLTPDKITHCSNKKVWWKCKKGHEWMARVASRNYGCGCPLCNKNGITLFNGVHCDSFIEAFYYLKYLKSGLVEDVDFQHNKCYSNDPCHLKEIGKIRYDFYLPDKNQYLEVTSFSSKNKRIWPKYIFNIIFKYSYVKNILGANFMFIQKELTQKEKAMVEKFREN